MINCHECNSEITDVDTFCPFCGTTLQTQINDSDDPKDDSIGEMPSDEIKETSQESEKDSDASTIEEPSESEENDSGYIDISTLKAEDPADDSDDEPLPEVEEVLEEPKSTGLELGSTGDLERNDQVDLKSGESEDIDLSQNQDDIEEFFTDEPEESEQAAIADADEKAIEVVTETVEHINDGEDKETAVGEIEITEDETDEPPGLFDKSDPTNADTDDTETNSVEENDDEFMSTTDLRSETELRDAESVTDEKIDGSKIHNTPSEIKEADDSEIEDAVSVIDSKALAWKENGESPANEPENIEEPKNLEKESETIDQESEISEKEAKISGQENGILDQENEILDEESDSKEAVEDLNKAEKLEDGVDFEPENVEVPIPEVLLTGDSTVESVESNDDVVHDTAADNEVSDDIDESEASVKAEASETDVTDENADESSDEKSAAVSSQTTPNIGVSDTDGNSSKKLKPLDEGIVLNDRYEIVRKIGGGGMGAVYLANDRNLGGVLRAVKEMVQSYIEEEQQEKAVQDFKRESMLLTSLDHPSIPTIYDYFYDKKEARFYLVMKYISGGDLAARLRSAPEGKLDEVSVTNWALQIADVLNYLHSKNPPIVYRDLKPANIMIDGNSDKVMLIDFGIARWINKEEKGVTAVGTMGYAPPELFSGNVEPSSDIYSLGSTMFHLLTGADPQNNPLLIFDFQKHPRPRQINPQLSDQMERILMRAVEYNSDKRFSSAAEMRNSLKEHLENLKAGNVSFGIKETPTAVALSDQPVYCGFCGQKIVATDMFCAFCGAKQPLAQPGVHSQEYHIPSTTAKLVIDGTSELDYQPFELVKNDNLVGRRDPMSNIFPEVDLSKFDPQTKISRKHARIWRDGENFILEDLGSSNGTTFISSSNEETKLMPKQSQILQNGDRIQVGDTTLQFMVD